MQVFFWIAFLILIAMAIFAIQNSSAPPVMIKFLAWHFETSLVYTILGSIGLGVIVSMLFWISRILRLSFKKKAPEGQDNVTPGPFRTKENR